MWKFIGIWIIASIVFAVLFSIVMNRNESLADFAKIDHKNKIVYVQLSELLVTGSDGACQGAGMVVLAILENLEPGWKVYVTNEWVPSRKNPIDIEWARYLAEGY